LTTGEGGAILTNNEQYAAWLSLKLAHGGKASQNLGLDFEDFGYNFRLSELQAAMGIAQIPQLEDVIAERRLLRERFIELLAPLGFSHQQVSRSVEFNVQSVVFVVPPHINRDKLVFELKRFGIESTLGTYAQSTTEYFANKYQARCLTSASLRERTITLPCFSGLDLHAVVSGVLEAISSVAVLK
jgi:dTDP-4-amino-4,6-dideoxygalactose transaminase